MPGRELEALRTERPGTKALEKDWRTLNLARFEPNINLGRPSFARNPI